MNPTTNSSIATALATASSIKSNPKAIAYVKNNAPAVEYAVFSVAIKGALTPLYALGAVMHRNKINATHGNTDQILDDADVRTDAGNAVQKILDSIGNVSGHKLQKNALLIDDLARCTVDTSGKLTGDALAEESNKKYYRDRIKEGGNDDFIAEMQEKLDIAKATSALLQAQPGSRDDTIDQMKDSSAITAIERVLMGVVALQAAKTPEQVATERAKAEEERKAKRKAQKKAKAQAAAAESK